MRKHVVKLLNIIISPLPPSSSNPYPFASSVKEWTGIYHKITFLIR